MPSLSGLDPAEDTVLSQSPRVSDRVYVEEPLISELVLVCDAELRMKVLLIFTLFLISVGGGESGRVMGYSGGGVLINCRYETRYTSNPKYLCKGPWSNCGDRIKTGVKNKWTNRGRFSLFDDTRAAQFWVVIRELTVEDSGTYKCGVDLDLAIDIYKPVELNVEEDLSYEKSISVTGHGGGGVNISCKYPQSHSSDPKFLCRRLGIVNCSHKTSVKESRRWINEGKLILHDDGKQIFTVVINHLTEGDSGEYWCGAESDWTSDHGYKVYITQINLTVTEAPATSPSSSTPQSTETPSSTTTVIPSFKTSTVSSVITVVSVVVMLLLIGLLIFIVTFRKRRKTQGLETNTQFSRESTGNFENDPTSCSLQPTKNTNQSDSAYQSLDPTTTQSDSAYQSLDPTTNQSVSAYQNLDPTTNQSDSAYQSLDPTTNQSVSAYQNLDPTTTQSDSAYQSLDPTTNQSVSAYQNLDPTTNQSDSAYQSLDPTTNQSVSAYQNLDPTTNQSDSAYQSLDPNTTQSDSVYHSLNPNTNQSDSVYHSLNPTTTQFDSAYQSLNPNTNQSDSVYHSLNPNTNQSDSV
ncbi:uncharacterized protein LOC108411734 [Pygocentrus nattereri]|nr:uncharacterized protein LOC108411734 [Pygocentrus nattereri]